ncbi:hypothetical protein J6590_021234, partial [Homalodisca vitripennis]
SAGRDLDPIRVRPLTRPFVIPTHALSFCILRVHDNTPLPMIELQRIIRHYICSTPRTVLVE